MTDRAGHAQVVIVGGGIVGCSIAYHLVQLGVTDVILLERGRLTCGTTWHAAGLIMQLRLSHTGTEFARYAAELYGRLEAETGQATGFKQNGTLGVCRSAERLHETRRAASIARSAGIEAHLLSPAEARELYPEMDYRLIQGAIYIPKDGQTNPVDSTMALAAGARKGGVRIREGMPVVRVEAGPEGGYRVHTPGGVTSCEQMVLACGLWTRDLASQLGINVPLHPCEHMYVVTEALGFVKPTLPVLRDPDGYVYIKEDAGKLLVGAFEPQGKPLHWDRLPGHPEFIELPEDWEHFELPYTKAAEILPPLAQAGISHFLNGPESFTPDLMFALGEAPGRRNCFIAAGFNSEGIEYSPAAGRALAEWMVQGEPTRDLTTVDIARFHPRQNNVRYLRHRAGESLGLHYKVHWPHKQREASRPVRKSPMHGRWVERNACFGEAMGWERPLWFAAPGTDAVNHYSYFQPNWYEHTAAECSAVRNGVAIFDQSSFGKHLVTGHDACAYLQRLCSGDVDVAPGRLVYTHMLNTRGGIETDITVNRLAGDRYLVVSSATTQPRDRNWMLRNVRAGEQVTVADVTSQYAVLSIQGPGSRALLQEVVDADLTGAAFPFATAREVDIGFAHALAYRLTYVGELGWELYIPVECADEVCGLILSAGAARGLRPAGYHAIEHLRLECGFREYQLDLTPVDTPLEAGLGFTLKLDGGVDFTGRDALLRQRERALTKRMVQFRLAEPAPRLFHDEPVVMDGHIAGYISSGAYSFTFGRSVGMGYVHDPDGVTAERIAAARFEIEVAGERHVAEASLRAFYDPSGARRREENAKSRGKLR